MDEAPAKGVYGNLTYTGSYESAFSSIDKANTMLKAFTEVGEYNRKLWDSMRKNSIECDACCRAHPVEDEYDADNLPQGWFIVIPGQGGGFKETMHFCSIGCLRAYAVKSELGPDFFDISQKPDRSLGDLVKERPRLDAGS